jgi:hypothetical protein
MKWAASGPPNFFGFRFPVVVAQREAGNGAIKAINPSYLCGVCVDKKFDLLTKII